MGLLISETWSILSKIIKIPLTVLYLYSTENLPNSALLPNFHTAKANMAKCCSYKQNLVLSYCSVVLLSIFNRKQMQYWEFTVLCIFFSYFQQYVFVDLEVAVLVGGFWYFSSLVLGYFSEHRICLPWSEN